MCAAVGSKPGITPSSFCAKCYSTVQSVATGKATRTGRIDVNIILLLAVFFFLLYFQIVNNVYLDFATSRKTGYFIMWLILFGRSHGT